MKTDYMVIGRTRNSENILRLIQGIEDKGFSCYNFLSKPCTPESDGLPWQEQMNILESHPDFWNDPNHRNHFEDDMNSLRNSDTIVLLLPAGMAAHMEAGVSYGLNKRLILIGEVEKPETLYLMFNERYPDIETFLATL
ncbi:hypothetical protein K2P47_02180 [Patescibacteria group bacterium]|nr:hypothetical protein [Patescibacteria group bacterium]